MYDYHSSNLLYLLTFFIDAAYLRGADEELGCPVRPDVPSLEKDILNCTEARRAAGEALPVLPGTTHISKVAFPCAPNFTIFNYIIQVSIALALSMQVAKKLVRLKKDIF